VIGHIRVHGADHRYIVDVFSHMGKKLTYFDAALAILLKFKRRGKRRAGFALGSEVFHRKRFAGQSG